MCQRSGEPHPLKGAHLGPGDLRDHPEISLNRLVLFDEAGVSPGDYVGMAENHWPDRAALDAAIAWYATPPGIEHNKDLESFMDVARSPTFVIDSEVEVSQAEGIAWKTRHGEA